MAGLESNTEWKLWGKEDPLWGVASWAEKQRDGASPWTAEEFYALGQSDWQDFLRRWEQYGMDRRNCLEIGCGAGRITKHLAATFDKVYAVDVSDHMIAAARKGVERENVEFSVIDGIHLTQAGASLHSVFSTHVLQHLDNVDVGYSYFREFARVLAPGGTLMIHLPVYQYPGDLQWAGGLLHSFYGLYRRLGQMKINSYRRAKKKIMRGTPYPIGNLTQVLTQLGFSDIEFRIFAVRSNNAYHPFVFATRSQVVPANVPIQR